MNDSRSPNRQEGERVERVTDPDRAEVPARPMSEGVAVPLESRAVAVDAQPGDRASAFRRLVGAALDEAYRRATVLLGDRFEAEDAVHDAAEKAWRGWGSLRDPDRFDAWFGRILVNTCRDRLRARRRVRRIEVGDDRSADLRVAGGDGGGGGFDAVDGAERLRQALDLLGADERIAVVLRYEADLTVPSIAAIVGAPEGTVKSRLHRALGILRTAYEASER